MFHSNIVRRSFLLKIIGMGLAFILVVMMSACAPGALGEVNGEPEPHLFPRDSIESGRRIIAAYGCGACHLIPGVPGADSRGAPPLNDFYQRTYIAGRLPNTSENLVKFIQHPQQIDPGNAMPDLGVTEDEAHDIVAYLYHQPTISDLIYR
jgi:cytochrome c2